MPPAPRSLARLAEIPGPRRRTKAADQGSLRWRVGVFSPGCRPSVMFFPSFHVKSWFRRSRGSGWRSGIAGGRIATQTTSIAHLGLKRFASIQMPIPSCAEQSEIVGILAGVDARINAEEASSVALKATKSALTSVLLTGELRVCPEGETA